MGNVVPFGKYKNQPVEVLAHDREYCDWLVNQGWVKERFPEFFMVIINNFGEPAETPAHNAMQARFLEDRFCYKFFHALDKLYGILDKNCMVLGALDHRQFEADAIDVDLQLSYWRYGLRFHRIDRWIEVPYSDWHSDAGGPYTNMRRDAHDYGYGYVSPTAYALELKPTLGDEYPAVLRQCLHQKRAQRALVIDQFSAKGATLEQVRQIFHASFIALVTWAEILVAPEEHRETKPDWIPRGLTIDVPERP